jgi:hypothetical protein
MTSPPPSTDVVIGSDQAAADASQRLFGRKADLDRRRRTLAGRIGKLAPDLARASQLSRRDGVRGAGRGGRSEEDSLRRPSQALRLHADVDEVRNDLIHDLHVFGRTREARIRERSRRGPADHPRTLPGGGRYFTDGRRVSLFLSTRPRTFADVEILQWEPILPEAR